MRIQHYSRAITLTSISLAAFLTLPGRCQEKNPTSRNQADECLNIADDHSKIATRYRAIRTIEDSGTHQHWLLLENLNRPGAPALLVQRACDSSRARILSEESELRSRSDIHDLSLPAIHVGDYLILSEHTRVFDAELEATALKTAAIGEGLTVRLKFGGRSLNAIATAPGRATLSEEGSEVHQ
jgi:hypothetical protein